ncbi:MAG: hypothetical protein R3E13_11545 [Alphaproteobacteria bacterium]
MVVFFNKRYGTGRVSACFKKLGAVFLFSLFFSVVYGDFAFAQTISADDVTENIITSVERLPGLVSAVAYLLGLLLGVLGVLKIKEHVENPAQVPLRTGIIRLIIGGALFALPIVYEAVFLTIGNNTLSFNNTSIANDISGFLGTLGGVVSLNFNAVLDNLIDSIENVPGAISAAAYLLGLVITIQGLLKIKDHVENPDGPQGTPIKEGVIRLLVGGALFALPTIYNAMFDAVGGNGLGIIGNITSLLGGFNFLYSSYAQGLCNPVASTVGGVGAIIGVGSGPSLGQLMCGILLHAGAFPAFLTACAYVIGLILGLWGIFKIRDHVLNPQQTQVWEGVSRLLAGGFFFALPIIVEVTRNTIGGPLLSGSALIPISFKGYNDGGGFLASLLGGGGCSGGGFLGWLGLGGGGGGGLGLDEILACAMGDIMGPLHVVLNFFAFVSGMILLMIGISRLIKSAQDGARGPGGIGTAMTFVMGAALISYNELVRAFSTTFVGSPMTATFAEMQYSPCVGGGLGCAEAVSAHMTISAILQFVIIVGLISFVRGIFIIRGVAEGNQQASVMAGITHIVGGALAVNLGPLINAVQTTLGLGSYGIAFS